LDDSAAVEEEQMLTTIQKIGPVLELFTVDRPEWRMSDIARELGTPKSSAHSLVATLAEIGLLSVGANGSYRLGWNLLSLSERMRASLDFRQQAVPVMQVLAKSLHETVLLAGLDRHDVVYVERVEGNHPMVRLAGVRPGGRLPAHATAAGKVLLAYRSTPEVRALMSGSSWKRLTCATLGTMDELLKALVDVRKVGYACDRGEIVPDIACVAAPIMDHFGSVVAAVSISVPAYRFPADPARLAEPLLAACDTIAKGLAATRRELIADNGELAAWEAAP
jgi:DNA-binding IclR family transcriptional regulator